MNNLEKLAQLFAERTNPFHIPVAQGKVISTSPLKVQFGDSIVLSKDHLVVNRLLAEGFTVNYEDDNGTTTVTKSITIQDPLQVGDSVILIPDIDHKTWYLAAKVGEIT
jgi:hypothetical protein